MACILLAVDNFWISPHYKLDKLASGNLEDKIDVFEDDIRFTIIEQAKALFKPCNSEFRHAGKAVLIVLMPYFETIAQYRKGDSSDGKSQIFFSEEVLKSFTIFDYQDPPRPLSVPSHSAFPSRLSG